MRGDFKILLSKFLAVWMGRLRPSRGEYVAKVTEPGGLAPAVAGQHAHHEASQRQPWPLFTACARDCKTPPRLASRPSKSEGTGSRHAPLLPASPSCRGDRAVVGSCEPGEVSVHEHARRPSGFLFRKS